MAKISNLLKNVGIDASEAIYFGDMVSDILYCRGVPIRIAAVGYGYQPMDYLSAFDPDHILYFTRSRLRIFQIAGILGLKVF
ncbi:MAG: hypothetical protein ISR72_10000 [Methylobacter sp.]|nr:hypothetical protein [Methylobacter sp.]